MDGTSGNEFNLLSFASNGDVDTDSLHIEHLLKPQMRAVADQSEGGTGR